MINLLRQSEPRLQCAGVHPCCSLRGRRGASREAPSRPPVCARFPTVTSCAATTWPSAPYAQPFLNTSDARLWSSSGSNASSRQDKPAPDNKTSSKGTVDYCGIKMIRWVYNSYLVTKSRRGIRLQARQEWRETRLVVLWIVYECHYLESKRKVMNFDENTFLFIVNLHSEISDCLRLLRNIFRKTCFASTKTK